MSDNLKPPGSLMIEVCGAQMFVGDGWQLCGLEPGHSGPHGWERDIGAPAEQWHRVQELARVVDMDMRHYMGAIVASPGPLQDLLAAILPPGGKYEGKYAYGVDQELLTAIALLSECRSTMPRTYGGEPNMTWVRVDAFLNRVGSDDNA